MNKKYVVLLIIVLISAVFVGFYFYQKPKKIDDRKKGKFPDVIYTIRNYKDNEYRVIDISDLNVYNKYYHKVLRLLVDDPKSLWNIVDSGNKRQKFDNKYETFLEYIKFFKTDVLEKNTITKYKVKNQGLKKEITIIDNNKYKFIFHEKGVNIFTVEILGQVK